MIREILFRGKMVDNWEWVEGCFVKYQPCASEGKLIYGIVPEYASDLYLVEIIRETRGQYTGLTDRNGTKIFEGDILSTDLSRPYNIVLYKNGSFMLQCEDNGQIFYDIFFSCEKEQQEIYPYGVVLGNIHDNPELLKGEENATD